MTLAPAPQQPAVQQPHFSQLHPSFRHHRFLIRRKFFAVMGAKLHCYAEDGSLLYFVKMKAFKLKEDITIFTDESMTQALVRIRARKILDFAATYDVFDVSTGGEYKVGALRRKGLKSLARDEWEILDQNDQPVGLVQEESTALAIFRRIIDIVSLFFPQQYNFTLGGMDAGFMKQTFNPFIMKMTADFSADSMGYFDRRLAAAAATLLCVIEGKQG